ncbi:MAG: hypothetical protein KGI52_16030, partial [Burkholderiales bacterium]|nr:hypothetical protein [Burkholderiales bacterium]
YDPVTYAVRVQIQPTGEQTGWIPIGTAWVGNGFGMAIGPNIGDMVRVDHTDGSRQACFMGARYFNDVDVPMQVPSGECWLRHQSGSLIKMSNDGKVTLIDKSSSITVMNGDGTGTMSFSNGLTINANVQLNGTLTASGNVIDLNNSHGSLQTLRAAYNGHSHAGVQPGSGTTSGPSVTV